MESEEPQPKKVRTNHVLIDLENVQPQSLKLLNGHPFKVKVFVGASQSKLSFPLVQAMQQLGEDAEYIKIAGNGPNALDFHIAFYIGLIASADGDCYFHIISKDTGFDPLIKHLKSKSIFVRRLDNILDIPCLRPINSMSQSERLDAVIGFLNRRGAAMPKSVKTLSNSLRHFFKNALAGDEVSELIDELAKREILVIDGSKVSCQIPSLPQEGLEVALSTTVKTPELEQPTLPLDPPEPLAPNISSPV